MADETNVEGTPTIGFSAYDNDEIELVSEDELRQSAEGDFATKSREELIAEVQQMKQSLGGGPKPEDLQRELEAVKQNMGSVSLDQLKALAAMQGGGGQPQQQPRETEEEFAERLKQSLYDDPVKAMDLYFTRKIAPDVQRLSANNMHWSQKALESDPEMGGIYTRYREAIDAEVQKATPQERLYDPKVYANAAQRVVATNINQIIAEKVQEALGKETAPKAPAAGLAPTFSETGMSVPPRGGTTEKVKVALNSEDKRRAFMLGISEKDYAATKARKEGKL